VNEAALPPCCAECLRLSDDCLLILEGCAFHIRPGGIEAHPQQKKGIADGKAKPFRTAKRQSRRQGAPSRAIRSGRWREAAGDGRGQAASEAVREWSAG